MADKSYSAVKGFNVVKKDGTIETSKGENKGKWIPGKTADNPAVNKGLYDPYMTEDAIDNNVKPAQTQAKPSIKQTTLDFMCIKSKTHKTIAPQK